MDIDFDALTTTRLADCFAAREYIPAAAAAELGGMPALLRHLSRRTTTVTMLAGSGSRWVASLSEAAAAGRDCGADPEAPRGLFPVRNAMGMGPDPIPIAGYALASVRPLGAHVIVVRGWEREIEDRILRPLAFQPGSWCFVTQEAPGGKPRGHGDAAFQSMSRWSGSEYVVVNFGGDASSPLTALAALAAMDALCRDLGLDAPALLMPAAWSCPAAYPIAVDAGGLPRSFGHAKLHGEAAPAPGAAPEEGAFTNVGVRVYRAAALAEAIGRVRREHWTPGRGYAIPGNDPAGGEFALDNVDALLASEGRARLLPVSRPEEMSPVKSLADLPRFGRDIELVCRDWSLVG